MAVTKTVENKNDKPLDYFGILNRSWQIVRKNKHLWFLGILAGTAGSGINFNLPSGSNQTAGDSEQFANIANTAVTWVQNNLGLVITAVVVLTVIGIFWWVLSVMATGGLVNAADKLDKSEPSSFIGAMKFGWHKFWRILGMSIVLGVYIVAVLIVLSVPVLLGIRQDMWLISAFYLIPAIIFFVLFAIVIGVVRQYALRYITLEDARIIASIKSGYGLLKEKKKESFYVVLMNLLIGIIGAFTMFFVIFLLAFLFGFIWFIFWSATSSLTAIIIYAIPAGLIFLASILLVGGFFSAFSSVYWTLAFKNIAKKLSK